MAFNFLSFKQDFNPFSQLPFQRGVNYQIGHSITHIFEQHVGGNSESFSVRKLDLWSRESDLAAFGTGESEFLR